MAFATISFMFAFLPISLILFYITPKKAKTVVLLLISLCFYLTLDPTNLLLMLLSISYDYLMAFLILKAKKDISMRKLPLIASIFKNLLMIIVFSLQNQIFGIAMPLGVMVYSLTSMGYVIDVYRGDELFEKNWFNYALFCTFFGKIFIGPIVQYGDIRKYIVNRKPSLSGISDGILLFLSGLSKQLILANASGDIYQILKSIPQENWSIVGVWLMILSFTFDLYFTLSGYCDMARGLALMFSMNLPKNYNFPFTSTTVSEFFERFNISVNQFTNRYIYVMLGADNNGKLSTILNTFLSAIVFGLWFGIDTNYLLWGMYFGALMLVERYFLQKYYSKIPTFLRKFVVFCCIFLSFAIFSSENSSQAWLYIKSMFGFGDLEFCNGYATYLLSSNILLILLCIFFLSKLGNNFFNWINRKHRCFADILTVVYNIILLGITTSIMLLSV